MTHAELKEIEGGLLLANATDIPSLKAKMETLRAELFTGSNFDNDPNGKRLSSALPEVSRGFVAEGVIFSTEAEVILCACSSERRVTWARGHACTGHLSRLAYASLP